MNRSRSHRVPNASLAPQLTEVPKADPPSDLPKLQRAAVRMHAYETAERPWHRELGITEGTVNDTPQQTPVGFDPARVRRYIQIAKNLNLGGMVPPYGEVEHATIRSGTRSATSKASGTPSPLNEGKAPGTRDEPARRGRPRFGTPRKASGMTVTTSSPSATTWNAWAADGRGYHVITETELIHFARHVPLRRGGVAVDAGCGTGVFSRQLYHFGYDVTGLDFADEALHAASRTRLPGVRYLHHDLNRVDPPGLPQHGIDLVANRLVLPYLDQPYAWVKRIRDHWLRPGGRLYLVIPVVDEQAQQPGGMTDQEIAGLGHGWGSVVRYDLRASLACLVLRTTGP